MKSLVLLFFVLKLFAQEEYSLRLAHGQAVSSDLYQILTGDVQYYPDIYRVTALDVGYLIKEKAFDLPITVYAQYGLSYFDEANKKNDVYENVVYIKAYWTFDALNKSIRFGFGEGGSYVNNILSVEYEAATSAEDNYSHYLNYLDISLDADLEKLTNYKQLHNTKLGFLIKHRSGIFGLINNVKHGGSNYTSFYIEKSF